MRQKVNKIVRKSLKQGTLAKKEGRKSIPSFIAKNTSSAIAAGGNISGTYTSSDGLFVIVFD